MTEDQQEKLEAYAEKIAMSWCVLLDSTNDDVIPNELPNNGRPFEQLKHLLTNLLLALDIADEVKVERIFYDDSYQAIRETINNNLVERCPFSLGPHQEDLLKAMAEHAGIRQENE